MAISHEMLKISTLEVSLKITNLRLYSHLPGTNELKKSLHFKETINGHITRQPLRGMQSWYPGMYSSLCNTFEEWTPTDLYDVVIMGVMVSQITSLKIVYATVYSGQRKHQSSVSLAFVRGIYQGPVNSPHKWPVTRKMFPFDDVIMWNLEVSDLQMDWSVLTG